MTTTFANTPGVRDRKAQDALDEALNRTVESYSLGEVPAAATWTKMEALLKDGADINAFRVVVDNSFLIWACRREDPGPEDAELVGKMLKAGAKPDVASAGGMTPLLAALEARNAGAVGLLLASGADIKAAEKQHDPVWGRRDAVYFALHAPQLRAEGPAQRHAQFDCLHQLLTHGVTLNKDAEAHIYAKAPHLAPLVDGMMEAMALHTAAEAGDAAEINDLLAAGVPADGAARFGGGPALTAATACGHLAAMKALIKGGAGLDTVSPADGLTPLLQAAVAGQREAFKLLFDAGADPGIPGGSGDTAISLRGACADAGMRAYVDGLLAEKTMTLQQPTALKAPLKLKIPGRT